MKRRKPHRPHETPIYGAASTVIENYDSLTKSRQIKLLSDVREDADWLIRMVENLLSVTRIGSGKVRISKTHTVSEDLADAAAVKFKKRYPQAPLSVSVPDGFITIAVDPLLIEQVLINLLKKERQAHRQSACRSFFARFFTW